MEDFDGQLDFDAPRDEQKRPGRNKRLMKRRELGRAQRSFSRHEIFSEEIGVFYHRALERLKNDAAFLQVVGNDIAFDQLVTGENHAPRKLIEASRILPNIRAITVR